MPLVIELVKRGDLVPLQQAYPAVDIAAKLREAAQAQETRMRTYVVGEPLDREARFRFFDELMRERPDRPEHARRKEAQHRKARRRRDVG